MLPIKALLYSGSICGVCCALPPLLLLTMFGAAVLVWAGHAQGTLDSLTVLSQVFFSYSYFSLYGPVEPTVEGLVIQLSFSVEEHFYLIWPVLFLLLMWGRIGLYHLKGLIVLNLIWRHLRVLGFGDDEWTIYVSPDTRFDSLLFGSLLAVMRHRQLGIPHAIQNTAIMCAY